MIILIGRSSIQCQIPVIRDHRTTHHAFLRRDHDHPVGRLHPVDSRCRSILQHRDRLDVLRIQPCNGITDQIFSILAIYIRGRERHVLFQNHPVNHPDRRLIPIDRGISPDSDLRGRTRFPGSVQHHHSGNTPLQHLVNRPDSLYHNIFSLYYRNGTCRFPPTNRLVTRHHHFLHIVGIILQHHVQHLLPRPLHFPALHPNERKQQCQGILFHGCQRKLPFRIRCHTNRRPFYQNSNSR